MFCEVTTITWGIHPCTQLFYLPSSLRPSHCWLNATLLVHAVSFTNVTLWNCQFTSSPFTARFSGWVEAGSMVAATGEACAAWLRNCVGMAAAPASCGERGVTTEAFRIYAWLSGSSRHLSLSQIKEHPILTQIHMSDQPSLWYLCHPQGDSGFGNAHYLFQGQLTDCLWLLMTHSAVFFTPLLRQTRQPCGFYSINAYPGPASCLVCCLVSQSSCWFWKSSTRYLSFCSQSQQQQQYSEYLLWKQQGVQKLGFFCEGAADCE